MAVAPFEQTCAGCHLDQILGKERVSGPKGIAFLSLPGLDLQTLKKNNLDRRMAGRLRSRAHTVHEGDDQPE